MDNLDQKVNEAEPSLASCDWKECSDLGIYMRCYLDIHKICPKYLKHRAYLRTMREMRDKHKPYKE